MLIGRLAFALANTKIEQLLSKHILDIIATNSQKYAACKEQLQSIVDQNQPHLAKIKCNLLFNTYSLSDSLQHLAPCLAQLIASDRILSQSELDQLVRWLQRQVKVNRGVGEAEIVAKLDEKEKEMREFEDELGSMERVGGEGQTADVCKRFRQRFLTIDSGLIYSKVSALFKGKGGVQVRRDNKLWDKLLEIRPRQLAIQCNSKEIYEQHEAITKGIPRFRFPPEPNGYLHIGHVKAIRANFETAKKMNGICYLRYDDTNPEAESRQFIEEIEENVRWLGYTPDKVTYASDYFEELGGFANELIKNGRAYVCESSQQEIQNERRLKLANPYRERSIESSLKIFPRLSAGQTLRLKGDPSSPNATLRDPVLYRWKSHPHPRTGSKYRIYPLYDFTHGVCDSLEHIDFSLCSLQFQVRRELYYTFLDLLGLYKPVVWEYSRVNVEGSVLSKRSIRRMIEEGHLENWDDPRLLTIRGLRNRGYTADMLIEFIDKVNCSRAGNQNVIQFSLLEREMKKRLQGQAVKTMGVLEPVRVTVVNIEDNIQCKGSKDTTFVLENQLYIEKADALRLSIGDKVILKYAGIFRVIINEQGGVKLSFQGSQGVSELKKRDDKIRIIHWIGQSQSRNFKVVTYDRLLDQKGELNSQSKKYHQSSRIAKELVEGSAVYVQLERIGFFKLSQDRKELLLCANL